MSRITIAAALLCCGLAYGETRVDTKPIILALVKQHGEGQRARITRGVEQVASLWRPEDGDLAAFAKEQFIAEAPRLDVTFGRFEDAFEVIDGHLNEITRDLRRPLDLDLGPILPIDPVMGSLNVGAHLDDDLFTGKPAFIALLNFPLTTLDDRLMNGGSWTRRQWAEARLTSRFGRRVPAAVQQEITRSESAGELYIAEYNLWMHHLVDEKGARLFDKGKRLISHWNLRDELRAQYADPDVDNSNGLARQRMITKVMDRIVTQTIPAAVIDNPRLDWNPFTNELEPAPTEEIEADAPERAATPDATRENDRRYQVLLGIFHARRKADPFSPTAPTALARSLEDAEIPEARLEALLVEVLGSPLVARTAAVIEKRLGRKLEPGDIWYAGFSARGKIPENQLDVVTRKKYPTPEAFARDIPTILRKLGFSKTQIDLVKAHVVVDPSRGAGHALESARRGDSAHLRTRVEKDGMNYKGYNIAVHELGHNVEQVMSLYLVDHTLLRGVPVTAITEALAFVFQARDLELLGLAKPDPEAAKAHALGDFWATFEISGVALVEIRIWRWLYAHPDATPAQAREAAVGIAREVWNTYYAPIFGEKDSVLLGIYSHMLSSPLYLYNYALGHLIAFQIEEQMAKAGKGRLGAEFERMTRQGRITPDEWMKGATGSPVGAGPLLRAAEAALE